ncbi:DUF4245 domain-containing protein [Nesterenkonia sp. HG001]|uniref:DUF4245 domain-containing protein n=1 Tax=Nesterenkonia sp. HG001 TaxID=2983207 RepID=UPI002AC3BA26|nr:DUF4245 domain-containing protein [Nesterenkonia sp. HG001]MDZ5076938.1 DUF4245 domain-containing protein [Nesterenkonia sp. HG001]
MTEREHEPRPSEDHAPAKPQLTPAQSKRISQPMVAMVITMAVTVGAVAAFYMMNPEPDVEPYHRDEDVHQEALYVAEVADFAPLAPDVPETWTANYARWETRPEHGVSVWEVGYTTDAVDFIGFAQTDQGNPTWIAEETYQATPTGIVDIEGLEFEVRDGDRGRTYYVLTEDENDVDGTTVVITGDASEEEFTHALTALVDSLGEEPDTEE